MASNSGARLLTLLGRARHTVTGSLSQGTHSQLTASGRRLEWDVSRCVAHRFTTGANAWMANGGEASGPGQLIEHMKAKIRDGLDAQFVDVVDMSGDARHVGIQVVANVFEGKNAINRQRMVYKCIWEEMQTDKVHAVQTCVTKTPAEAESK